MFQKIKRSLRDHSIRPATDNVLESERDTCHTCGQSLIHPVSNGDNFVAKPYELYEPRDRGSWNSSGFSDSGYGSFSSSKSSGSLLQLDGTYTRSETLFQPPTRRSTSISSAYSTDAGLEEPSTVEMTVKSAQRDTPGYQHSFHISPQSSNGTSQEWKPRSRYAILNELPATTSEKLPYNYDVPIVEALDVGIHQDGIESGKEKAMKRLQSLLLRSSSLKKLVLR
ncbi:hypothetical protein VM1G_11428 [Cytospora mali]|uniref:Uncharacterized protein n=1 Tax=Cytospora mali TaxID=578113 RepID=A0A194VSC0_CYTMA|nr:hypothetical protein VM1G_11428 [Valsa mali]